ncbi:23S rRNA (uracil(1939)-C(5))-methyltransferase RlmD [Alteromonas pelagimontana]|uniref:23S rRNA (Uracil(1939)-C(5))-methyltransferase RlmD n=1 Tax=Alteromonas pelagimontana TaxID=1858656 RepID=A0A6M4MCI3_9ALTE|nr:hypothetical protein [Alteromonas pelagimontana]QJR80265.1 23S rRNA (uracil(1939)-C(5))-methyltransferase RlmD [Alteromonas pelagimontana]
MANFYTPTKRKLVKQTPITVYIDEMDMQGQGVSTSHSPVLFVEGALPGETCEVVIFQRQKQFAKARLLKVLIPSAQRTTPFCPLIARCGGCQLQHVFAESSLAGRQKALGSYWQTRLGLTDIPWQPPLTGRKPDYRRKARLAVDARDCNNVKVGYREQGGKNIVNVPACPILEPELSAVIAPLKQLLTRHAGRHNVGHISLLKGDNVAQVTVKIVRALGQEMMNALVQLGKYHAVNIVLERPDGEFEVAYEHAPLLCQTEPGITLSPMPNDFVQVNSDVNRQMIERAMEWLAPQPDDKIADWFCGLGNFSLSLAKRAASVQAIEGVAEMVRNARNNALQQGITNIDWLHLDLGDPAAVKNVLAEPVDSLLLDPSREGAQSVCELLARQPVPKILYVSCNPSSFTRDAKILLSGGYQMDKVSVIEMFPYTRHLETMALFTHNKTTLAS